MGAQNVGSEDGKNLQHPFLTEKPFSVDSFRGKNNHCILRLWPLIRVYAGPTPIHVSAALMRLSVLLKKEKKNSNTCEVKRGNVGVIGRDRKKTGDRYDHKSLYVYMKFPRIKSTLTTM